MPLNLSLEALCSTIKKIVSIGGDNAEDKVVGNAAPVASDEGESHHSRDDHS